VKTLENLTLICAADRLSDPGSLGFSLESAGERIDGFVVRRDGEFFAYRNSCPHTGSPLEWVDHQFLDMEGALIQCATHDARFLIDPGNVFSALVRAKVSNPCRSGSGTTIFTC